MESTLRGETLVQKVYLYNVREVFIYHQHYLELCIQFTAITDWSDSPYHLPEVADHHEEYVRDVAHDGPVGARHLHLLALLLLPLLPLLPLARGVGLPQLGSPVEDILLPPSTHLECWQ